MTIVDRAPAAPEPSPDPLPRWSVADVHESLTARSFTAALEAAAAAVGRLRADFDELGVRALEERAPTVVDGATCDRVLDGYNAVALDLQQLAAYVAATVTTNSRDERAQSLRSELEQLDSAMRVLLARLAEWVRALGPEALAARSPAAADHLGPLRLLAARAAHQMTEPEEGLYAELGPTGARAWARLQADLTSQLAADVELPGGARRLPMPAVRGLATDPDPAVRRAGYDAELRAWPQVATACAAAMNAVKGDAGIVERRRGWASPLDASLFANSVSRPTFDAMQAAIDAALDDLRGWMRRKAALHAVAEGRPAGGGLAWWDLVAPLPMGAAGAITWEEGVAVVRDAFSSYSAPLAGLVDRALTERWIDAAPRDGKVGGAFCMPFVGDRSLVLLNWSGSLDAAQTTAHELGHAYHNTQLATRTPLQRRLPMALAETASIFCETLVVEAGLAHLDGDQRLALLDVDLQGTAQVVVDIRSRLLFETEVFARRRRRTLGASELDDLMRAAQHEAYADGLDQTTAHPHMWILKPHYYSSQFYNWPYTFGLLFGLGLFARHRADPERFRDGYDDLLSRAGMATAEELGASFGFDLTDEGFWTASLDVVRDRIRQHAELASPHLGGARA